ncbi:hypothetical protein QBC42DRAFT_26507 [Cladorrhinum samala]|uniref:MARVEL domain-containing protein n=1 Tax=Cladorrhinum samala TaxID=585594 RepID=A0AAV9HCU9_9PEZI|nr:hypothetical protein QBC42DRAFT_26507 [Cladorrhinum samala]
MGSVSKVFSVILRLGELACAAIIVGLLGWFLARVDEANVHTDPRIIYTMVIACIALALSIVLLPPFTYSFMAFPLDFIFFVLFLVAFCLLETLTGNKPCNSSWYLTYWGYYWGGFFRTPTVTIIGPSDIGWSGCASWKANLAFNFILSIVYLMNAGLGFYVVMKYREEKKAYRAAAQPGKTYNQPVAA